MKPKVMQKHITNQCKHWYRTNQEIHGHFTFRKWKIKQIRRKGHRISRFRKVRARTEIHQKYIKNDSKIHSKIDTQTNEKQGMKMIWQKGGKGVCGSTERYPRLRFGGGALIRHVLRKAMRRQAKPGHAMPGVTRSRGNTKGNGKAKRRQLGHAPSHRVRWRIYTHLL